MKHVFGEGAVSGQSNEELIVMAVNHFYSVSE